MSTTEQTSARHTVPTVADEPFTAARADAEALAQLTEHERHDVAIVLGSGWTPVADALGRPEREVGFAALPHFPRPTVAGHAGSIRSVIVGSRRVLVLSGRVHLYEGLAPARVVHPVRTAVLAGCKIVVLTNAAGSLRPDLPVGAPVLIADHLNLSGQNPLTAGPPPEPYPERFCDLSDAYSARLRAVAREVDPSLPEGVYAALLGPSYETPAEIRMLRTLGADLVGMSTALETIAAVHLGAEVLGLALVTNLAAGLAPERLDHAEVLAALTQASERLGILIRQVVDRLP